MDKESEAERTIRKAVGDRQDCKHRIYTVGHGNRTFKALLEILHGAAIKVLVDIRSYPRSKRNPQFDREKLEQALPKTGTEYLWLKAMGGFRRKGLGKESPHVAMKREGFRNYADHMLTAAFHEAVDEVMSLSRKGGTCLMCAETHPLKCHRWLVSDHLVAKGMEVVHLLRPKEDRRHTLSTHARIQNGDLYYDRVYPIQKSFDFHL